MTKEELLERICKFLCRIGCHSFRFRIAGASYIRTCIRCPRNEVLEGWSKYGLEWRKR